jgi:hypothetical protein
MGLVHLLFACAELGLKHNFSPPPVFFTLFDRSLVDPSSRRQNNKSQKKTQLLFKLISSNKKEVTGLEWL